MGSLLRSLFGDAVAVAEGPVADVDEELFPEERSYVRTAVAARRREFGTARSLARRALAELGAPRVPLVPRVDRAPSWPVGFVGSISHTREQCAVVVARGSAVQSLGLDIETVRELDAAFEAAVLLPPELEFLRAHPPSERALLVVLFFSAKEAYYKCQYPISGALLEHCDVEVELDMEGERFVARAEPSAVPGAVRRLEGRFAWSPGSPHMPRMTMCGVELRRAAAPAHSGKAT